MYSMDSKEARMKHREICRDYYRRNRDTILESRSRFRMENRAKLNAWYRDYYQKNRAYILKQRKDKRMRNQQPPSEK